MEVSGVEVSGRFLFSVFLLDPILILIFLPGPVSAVIESKCSASTSNISVGKIQVRISMIQVNRSFFQVFSIC